MITKTEQPSYISDIITKIESSKKYNARIGDLAREVGVSVSKLEHDFKFSTGFSIKSYQVQIKMRNAIIFLSSTQYSIKHIAALVGYRSSASFSHAFKKITSKRPSDYRKGENS